MQPVMTQTPPDRIDSFAASIDEFMPGFSNYLPTQGAGASDWIDSLAKTAGALAMTNAQRELLEIQLDRARQGLPPLDSSQYGLGATVGISRDTIITAGAVLGGLVVLWAVLNRRRGS